MKAAVVLALATLMVQAQQPPLQSVTDRSYLGFSAGGHLATYPVISMTEPWTHPGSKSNLLGDRPDPDLAVRLSGEKAVTKDTPPTFVFQTNEDRTVLAENSLHYFLALRQAGVPAEMHVFEKGPHGAGLANADASLAPWSALLANWLRGRAFIK